MRTAAAVLSALVLAATVASSAVTSSPAQAQEVPDTRTPAGAAVVTSLPATTSAYGVLSDVAERATDDAGRAVARACVPGGDIAAPHWVLLRPATPTTVLARTQPTWAQGRDATPMAGGLALVSPTTGEVLECATRTGLSQTGPRLVGSEGLLVVAFLVAADWTPGVVLDHGRTLPLHLTATDGRRPANDDRATATTITSLPFTDAADRSMATSSPDDRGEVGGDLCGWNVPVTGPFRSVWYRFVPAEPIVLGGPETSRPHLRIEGATQVAELTAEGPRSLDCVLRDEGSQDGSLLLEAGTTYLVQVADVAPYGTPDGPVDQGAPRTLTLSGTGRLAGATTASAVPASARVQVDAVALDGRSAAVSGSLTCTAPAGTTVTVSGDVTQSRGRSTAVQGFGTVRGGASTVVCDGTRQPWRAAVPGPAARYSPGEAVVRAAVRLVDADGTPVVHAVTARVRVVRGH